MSEQAKETLAALAAGSDLGRRLAALERRRGVRAPKVHLEFDDRTGAMRVAPGWAPCPTCPTEGGMALNHPGLRCWKWPAEASA